MNQLMSCHQACKARRQGATQAQCLGACKGPRKCSFELAGLSFPACTSCGIDEGYKEECHVSSTKGCAHGCTESSGKSGLGEDAKALDNSQCDATPANSERSGPDLSRYSAQGWHPLAVGFGAHGQGNYGPELAFGALLGEAYSSKSSGSLGQPMVVKVSMGGSSLADHWRVGGSLYNQLIGDAQDALAANKGSDIGGFVWFQGFNDQFDDAWCRGNVMDVHYGANLKTFFAAVRQALGKPELPIVIVKARNGGDAMKNIQQGQDSVAAGDANIAIVASADTSECFHYDSGAQIVIGERAANAMLQLMA